MSEQLFETPSPVYTGADFPPPRVSQVRAHGLLQAGARQGHRCQILMAPTGAGKTYLGLQIIHRALVKGRRAMFLCDRIVLINQTSAVSDSYGLKDHGIIQADNWRTNAAMPFQIASVQTMAKREWPTDLDVLVIDECHTQFMAWVEFIKMNTKASVIGLSATPFSKGLGQLFTNLVSAATMAELVADGVLVPMRPYTCTPTDMKDAPTSNGEWTDKAVEERGLRIVGDVVTEWQKLGENRKTIVFGSTIAHCEELCRQYNEAGVMAGVFCQTTTERERERLLTEYRKPDPQLRVLVSVEALAKGFDVPDVGCIVDCRPLRKSLSTFIQMIGRGARSSPATGKEDFILLDHSGNIVRFLHDFEDIYYNGLKSLDSGEKLDRSIRKEDEEWADKACPKCGYKPFSKRCLSCGFEKVTPALVTADPGEMTEIFIGKNRVAADAVGLWNQVCSYTKQHGRRETSHGRACHIFRDITGSFPPMGWYAANAPMVDIHPKVIGKIRSRAIAHSAVQKKQAT